jgi:hypothetical protein
MNAKRISYLTVILFIILTAQKLFAAEYALAVPTFVDRKCTVVIWIHDKSESKQIIYPGKYSYNLCHVEIPAKQFEKHFRYCMLAGIDVGGSNNYLAQFGGGAGGNREIYWFSWRNPHRVFPTFNCVLRQRHSK